MIQALGWALVYFLWQGTAIALLLALALRLLRRADANVRYLTSCAALLLMLAAPLLTFLRLDQPASVPAPAHLVFTPLPHPQPRAWLRLLHRLPRLRLQNHGWVWWLPPGHWE